MAVTSGALPLVFPVTFQVMGERILFRTGQGTTLHAATRGSVVAFEADQFDPGAARGWSVLVTGVAREVCAPAEERSGSWSLPSWERPGEARTIAISTDLVSGRRLLGP